MPAIPLPRAISITPFSAPAEPTYTQIFNDTMGKLATPEDGADALLAELLSVGDAFGVELAADAAADPVGAAVNLFAGFDPSGLDLSIAGFESTRDTGLALIADAASTTPPILLTLPISPLFDGGIGAPPVQVGIDAGAMKVGDPPKVFAVGSFINDPQRGVIGMGTVQLQLGDPSIFQIVEVTHEDKNGTTRNGTWSFKVTPAKIGQFVAQILTISTQGGPGAQIITYKVSVT